MNDYVVEIQNVVRTAVDEYRVTIRLYDEAEMDRHRWSDGDAPFVIHSMTATLVDGAFRFVAEGALGDCIKTYRDNDSFADLPKQAHDSWKIGALADSVMSSLADRGFMEAWYAGSEN